VKVTIYTKPNCVPCWATKNRFDKFGIPYEEVPAEDAVDYIAGLGYTSAPVVEVDLGEGATVHWSQFRPEMIEQLRDTIVS
jgi:glutaredoxin-like protein NrdH